MDIKWLVQDEGFSSVNKEATHHTLEQLGYRYDRFGVSLQLRYVKNLEHILENPEQHFIVRGGTQILSFLENVQVISEINEELTPEQIMYSDVYIKRLKEGIFYDAHTFDQAYYRQFNLPLLNSDASLYPIKDNLELSFSTPKFIKPSKDQKSFNAGILEPGQTIKEFVYSQIHMASYIDEQAIVASCKNIAAEYRFFVVNQEVVSGSRYRFGGKLNISEVVPSNVLQAAKEYAKLYQPHMIFTMDLAETNSSNNPISIIEYNCWNASGFYKTDISKTFFSVQEYMSEVWKNNHIYKKHL